MAKDTLDSAIEEAEQHTDEAEIRKAKQQAEQEAANSRRERERNAQLSSELARLNQQAQEQARQLAELKGQKEVEKSVKDQLGQLDPANIEIGDVAKAHNDTAEIVARQASEIATLKTEMEKSKRQSEQSTVIQEQTAILNKVCAKIEKDLDAVGLRNEALVIYKQLETTEGEPENPAEATLRLRDCYTEAKKQRDAIGKEKGGGKKPTPKQDTGGGGSRPSFMPKETKPGSMKEVLAQYDEAAD